jgi:hypothetical protein
MSEAPSREDLIGLLERLDSELDEDVLAAARELQSRVAAAGLSWEDLLAHEAQAADAGEDREDAAAELAEAPAGKAGGDGETLALIEKMLARSGISEHFREELEGYKQDIAEGEFENSDHDYVRALYKRLSARR